VPFSRVVFIKIVSVLERFLDGRSFVYRANSLEKLTDLIVLLESWFPGARLTADKKDINSTAADKKVKASK